MAVIDKKKGTRSDQNPDSSRRVSPFGAGQSSRKFFGKAAGVAPVREVRSRSNAEFVVGAAARINALSSAVAAAAEVARESLTAINELIQSSVATDDGNLNETTILKKFSSGDITSTQNTFALDVGRRNGATPKSIAARRIVDGASENVARGGILDSSLTSCKVVAPSVNKAVPSIDFIGVQNGARGSIDSFFTKIVFTLSNEVLKREDVRAFRIFRATKEKPESTRPIRPRLSIHGIDELRSNPQRTGKINHNQASSFQIMLDNNDIVNSLSETTVIDSFTGKRVGLTQVSSSDEPPGGVAVESNAGDDRNLKLLSSFIDIPTGGAIDFSVVQDLNFLKNVSLQNPDLVASPKVTQQVGNAFLDVDTSGRLRRQQVLDVRGTNRVKSNFSINKANQVGYKEIAFIPRERTRSRIVGNLTEFSFVDETVELG